MKARYIAIIAAVAIGISTASARGISVSAISRPAAEVFSQIMNQSNINFVYASGVLKDVNVTVHAKEEPLEKVLEKMFSGTDVTYKIKGNVVTLKRKPAKKIVYKNKAFKESKEEISELPNVTVIQSRNRDITMRSSDVGHLNLSRVTIASTPTMFGESDVIKTLQLQPGVSAGTEGLAGMYVHGGGHDENLYMLDNIPLYQINHFGGLFSAFNTETIKNVDFYKSTFPARYDGRLSSVVDVHTKDGSMKEHHGSFKLGLTSGAFNIDGPIINDRTTYSLAVRRSWYDVLSIPALAIFNKVRQEKEATTIAQYSFMDVNAKIRHRFDDNMQAKVMFYYGNDYLKGGSKNHYIFEDGMENGDKDISRLNWGNLVASAGLEKRFSSTFTGELTAAYTHYRSTLNRHDGEWSRDDDGEKSTESVYETRNDIHDWTVRTDMDWKPSASFNMTFGANFTAHSYTPEKNRAWLYRNGSEVSAVEDMQGIKAKEYNVYAGGDWDIAAPLRASVGASMSMYDVDGRMHKGLNPRASLRWIVNDKVTLKAAYSKMSQYVQQLTTSTLSLPTDQWVPIAGDLKPQRSDKVALGAYWDFHEGMYNLGGELYYKWMHNITDYRDDWALLPGDTPWAERLCSGTGRAKGLDLILTKRAGKFTGHVSYSLLFADRKFEHKNQGLRFPARFDNRHKFNILLNWRINDKWEVNASWTGMSGNRITLPTQAYDLLDAPNMPYTNIYYEGTLDMNAPTNNYRLPFYHRMDVGVNRYTKHGMWNFSLYNAYCNMNVISIRKNRSSNHEFDHFETLRLIPILPSVSYTWFF